MAIGRLTLQLLNESGLGSLIVWQAADSMGGGRPNSKRKKNSQYLVLEPRMMFDGAMEVTFETLSNVGHDATDSTQGAEDDTSLLDALSEISVETLPDNATEARTSHEFVFIDDGVEDFDVIMAELGPDVEVFILNGNSDGVEQIAAVLSNHTDVTAIHIISHGNSGELSLGSTRLDAGSIAGEHAAELAVIAASLSTNADILIYGCEFGLGEEGQSAMQALANATRADVAASDDLTGAVELGGDWLLETESGFIETGLLRLEAWSGTLNLVNTGSWAVVGNTASNTTSGITSTITFAPTAGGTVALNATPQVFNTATGLFTNGAEGDPSLGFTYTWDTTPEAAAGVPQPDATSDDAPMTVTITFSTPVTNPIINIDRLGGNGTFDPNTAIVGDEDSRSNSSLWTITTPGATLTELAGVGHFDVTSTTFQRTSNAVMATTGISGEAGTNALINTAAGTIQVLGTYTTLTFVVTGIGVEGAGADGIEIGLALDAVPNAQNDSFTMNEDATLTGNLFANNGSGVDADPAGDSMTITQVNGAAFTVGTPIALANGSLTITNATTGTFTFTPNAHYVGGQPFTYTVADANGGTDTANVNITVNNVNDAPAGADNTLTTNEDTAISLSAATFGFSDPVDSPGNSLQSVIITTLPTTGTLTLSGGAVSLGQVVPAASLANLLWTPALNSTGTGVSSFTFQVVDNGGTANGGQNTDQSANTITFNVAPQNDPPVAVNDGPITAQPGAIVNIAPLANDTDIDVDALSITHVINPANPGSPIAIVVGTPVTLTSGTTVTLLANGTLDVVMARGNDSIERFDYIISDGNGGTDQATVALARDTDGDGVKNSDDIDDDNDGILDTVEEAPGQFDIADFSGWVPGARTGTVPMPNGGVVAINTVSSYSPGGYVAQAGFPRGTTAPELATFATQPEFVAAFPEGLLGPTSGLTIWTATGAPSPVTHSVSLDFTGTTAGVANEYSVIGISGIYPDFLTVYDAKITITAIKADGTLETDYTGWDAINPNAGYGGVDANGAILNTALESATATPTGFVLDPANISTYSGNQDLVPVLIKLPEGSAYRSIIITREKLGSGADNEYMTLYVGEHTLPPDTDNDGLIDALDLDSDNDGILDNIEAQSTAGYVAPSGVGGTVAFLDANSDGLDDTYDPGALGAGGGIGLTPVNTDGIDTADWRDLNSDNDALSDNAENGLGQAAIANGTLSTALNDADGDGLFDQYETAIDGDADDGFVVNEGEFPYPPTASGYLPDSGLDSIPTVTPLSADLDFRDATEDNFAPTSTGGAETTPEDTPYIFTAADFNFADINPGNTLQSVRIDTLPAQGTLFLGVTPVTLGQVIAVGSIPTLSYLPPTNLSGANLTSFTYSVNDGIAFAMAPATMQLSVTPVNDPPVLNLDPNNDSGTPGDPSDDGVDDAGFETTFIENAIPVKIVDTDMILSDPENNITEIVITLTDGLIGDKFTFPGTLPGGISPSAIPATILTADGTIVLTFTGAPGTTTADWNALLQLISFEPSSNASDNPNPADRHITVEALDASNASSGELTTTIHVSPVNDPPTLDLDDFDTSGVGQGNYQGTFTENGLPVPISNGVIVNDFDDTNLESMTITLTNGQIADVLTIGVLPAGITLVGVAPSALTAPGTITLQLTGSASLADYQTAIAAIGFSNASDNPVESVREITVVGSDGDDLTPLRTAYITVDAVNDAPVATSMPPNTGIDAAALTPFDVTTYFSDVDNINAQLAFSLDPTTTPSWMSLDGNGNIVGTPPNDASQNTNTVGGTPGVYTISVTATDPAGLSSTTTITYTISNPPPDAQEDALGTQENAGALSGNVFGPNPTMLDSDADGDTFTVTAVAGLTANVDAATAGSTGGTFQIAANGALTFLDNGDFEDLAVGESRDTTITYTITDADGGSDTATVTVTVLGTNDGPVAVVGNEIPNQNGVDDQLITPIDVTATFSDADTTDVLTYTATGLPLGLVLDLNTGIISGVLDSSASQNGNTGAPTSGVYTIVVTANDGHGGTVTDTFTYTVSNPPPDAVDDQLTVNEDFSLAGLNVMSANGGLADSDPDGDTPLTVTQVNGLPANVNSPIGGSDGGTFIISSVGVVSFDPGADFQYLDDGETATTTVMYQLSDGEGGFDTAIVTVTVSGANDAPLPVDPTNPTGPTDPNNYIPDQSGTDGASLTPFATSVYFADPDTSDTLTYSSPDIPAWMIINPTTGEITGLPPLDASTGGPNNDGVYPITIVVSDGDETFSTTLDYTIGNLPPDAVNDSYVANEDTILTVPSATGLIDSNDTDGDGDTLTVSQLNGVALIPGVPVPLPSGSIVTLNADGSFDYNPNGAFEALAVGETDTDSFTYHVADGDGLFDTATVTITIEGANDVPIAEDDAFAITENGIPVIGNVFPINGTVNPDRDVDATDVLSVTEVGGYASGVGAPVAGSMGGLFTINSNGDLEFVDNGEFEDLDDGETRDTTVTYQLSDGQGGFDLATVTVTVTGVNDAPIPVDSNDPTGPTDPNDFIPDVTSTDGAAPTDPNVAQYFADPEGDSLTFAATNLPPGLVMNSDGAIFGVIDPDASQGGNVPGQPGVYLVTISADDGDVTTTTTITYTITNLPPIAVDDVDVVSEDGPSASGNVLTGVDGTPADIGVDTDSSPDSDPFTVYSVGGVAGNVGDPVEGSTGGTFTINENGTWTFDPGTDFQNLNTGETRETTVTYKVMDGQGGFADATLTVVVQGATDAPVALGPIPPQNAVDGVLITPIDAGDAFNNPTGLPLEFIATNLPEGLVINPGTGVISGTPASDASVQGPYVVMVTATNPTTGQTSTIPVQINVTNPPPIAVEDATATPVDTPVLIAPLGNDTDPDGDELIVTVATDPANGTVVINPDGTLTYMPGAGFIGTDTFTYTISDGQGGMTTADVTVTVGTSPENPIATSLPLASGNDSQPITPIDVTSSFADPNGDPLTFTATGLPPGLTMNPDGTITGSLPSDASIDGPYTVLVTATDPDGNQVTIPMIIAVANPTPVAEDDNATTPVDTPVVLNLIGNDTDLDGDDLAVTFTGEPANGTVVVNADGTVTYIPNAGFEGTETFTYTVSDGQGGTDTATVTIVVSDTPPPGVPTATSVAPAAFVDGATIAPIDLTGSFVDPTGQPLVFTATGLPEGLTMNPDGTITGSLPTDASEDGPYIVMVTATDPDGNQVTMPLVITVSNPAPVAEDDATETPEDTSIVIGVTGNDTDPDGDIVEVTATTAPANGTVVINPDGTITYTPNAGFTGTDTFTYTITDDQGSTSTATVTVNVGPVTTLGPLPTITPVVGTDGEAMIPVDVSDIFGDPDSDTPPVLSVDPATLPPGIVFDPETGTFTGTFEPDASQGSTPGEPAGTYIVPVTVTDEAGNEVVQLVTFTITNPPPVAVDDVKNTVEDTAVSGNVLTDGTPDHDTAPDSDLLTVTSFSIPGVGPTPAGNTASILNVGTLVVGPTGAYTFTPAPNYEGPVPVVTYTISDGNGGTDEGTLSLTIAPVNDLPVVIDPNNPGNPLNPIEAIDPDNIIPDIATTDGATPTDPNVAQYFADPESDLLTFTAADLPPGLFMNPDGRITGVIDPDASQSGNVPGQPGVYLVTITADDSNGGVATTTVTYTITNPPPVAIDDAPAAGNEDMNQTGNVLTDGTPDHDTAPDSDPLTVTSFNIPGVGPTPAGSTAIIPNVGTLLINLDGSYAFDPASNYDGAVPVVTYTISDGNGGTDEGTLSLTITPVNDPPVVIDPNNPGTQLNPNEASDPDNIIPDIAATDGASPTDPNVAQYFADPESDPLTFTAADLPPGLVMNPDGSITGVIDSSASQGGNMPGQPGVYLVTITADDGDLTTTTTVTYTVANIPPIAVDDVSSALEDLAQNGNVLTDPVTGDADGGVDTDSLTVVGVTGGAVGSPISLTHGTLTLNADGTWNFAPNAAANALPVGVIATEQVTYTINDGNGGIDTATLTINLIGTNDAPLAVDFPDQSNYEGAAISIPASAAFTDPDGDALTFTATGLPAGLTIDSLTGVISGTIDNGAANFGPYTIVVTADDGHGGTVTATFDWEVLALGAPTIEQPQGPAPLPQLGSGILSEGQDFILRSVSTLRPLDGTPTLGKLAVTTATNGLAELNGNVDLIVGDGIISQLVEWLGRQGKQANWMHDLFEAMEHEPYVGDSLDLALTLDGTDLFRIKTVIHNGALYFGVDETADGVQVISISETGAFGLPDNVTRISAQDIIANLSASSNWLDLTIVGQLADGRRLSWMVSVNPDSGEVIASNFKNGLIANHHIESGDQLSAQLLQPFDYAAE